MLILSSRIRSLCSPILLAAFYSCIKGVAVVVALFHRRRNGGGGVRGMRVLAVLMPVAPTESDEVSTWRWMSIRRMFSRLLRLSRTVASTCWRSKGSRVAVGAGDGFSTRAPSRLFFTCAREANSAQAFSGASDASAHLQLTLI